ncbi:MULTISPECIES: phage head spike fiber domain-containing protein [Pseudomonadota]|uniref:phage head spike fiber domain-containing protein n=1 Tax=Pseudomonadota TaxID=1224 RepID=UPI003AA83028
MTNSVTFPVALGGDGKTYTDDADPETGLDGLGYITRLIPLFKNGVAMTGYTAKYAAKIDAAAANADRAEDAKRYVEAVAEAYKVNLLEQFKRDATLGLDFVEGRYWKDDGERFETTDPSQIMTIQRNGPKHTLTASGRLKEYAPDNLAREYGHQARQYDALIEGGSTNSWIYANDFGAVSPSQTWIDSGIESPLEGANYKRHTVPLSGSSNTLLSFHSGGVGRLTISVFVGYETTMPALLFNLDDTELNSHRACVDLSTDVLDAVSSGNAKLTVTPCLNGRVLSITFDNFDVTTVRGGVLFKNDAGSTGYASGDIGGLSIDLACMSVVNRQFSSFIPTAGSATTKPSDAVTMVLGEEFNASGGTFIFEHHGAFVDDRLMFFAVGRDANNYLSFGYNTSTLGYFVPQQGSISQRPPNYEDHAVWGVSYEAFPSGMLRLIIAINGSIKIDDVYEDGAKWIAEWNRMSLGSRFGSFNAGSVKCAGLFYKPVPTSPSVIGKLTQMGDL